MQHASGMGHGFVPEPSMILHACGRCRKDLSEKLKLFILSLTSILGTELV